MNIPVKKISVLSMLLSLGVIFNYVSTFIPFFAFAFLNVDLSVAFVLLAFSLYGYWSAFFMCFAIGLFSIAWSTTGIIGPMILIVSNLSFISIYFLISKLIKIKKIEILNVIISIIINAIFLSIINGIIFTPIFLNMFTDIKTINFIEIANNYNSGLWYEKLKIYFMFIPDYWLGIFSLYTSFNLFKFLIGGIAFIIFKKIIEKNDLLNIKN
ncbi:MAG: MPN527 family putative ECF transporter permease subunit [Mycoplasmoidaceae bacterium]